MLGNAGKAGQAACILEVALELVALHHGEACPVVELFFPAPNGDQLILESLVSIHMFFRSATLV